MGYIAISLSFIVMGVFFWCFYRDDPKTLGLKKFGSKEKFETSNISADKARSMPILWLISATLAIAGFASSGSFLHLKNLFLSVGKDQFEAIVVLKWIWLPTFVFLISFGLFSDRLKVKTILLVTLLSVSFTCLGLVTLNYSISKYLFIVGFGGTAATYTITEAVAWVRIFGTAEMGEIKGIGARLILFIGGISPLCFSASISFFNSYSIMGYIVLALIVATSTLIILDKTE